MTNVVHNECGSLFFYFIKIVWMATIRVKWLENISENVTWIITHYQSLNEIKWLSLCWGVFVKQCSSVRML